MLCNISLISLFFLISKLSSYFTGSYTFLTIFCSNILGTFVSSVVYTQIAVCSGSYYNVKAMWQYGTTHGQLLSRLRMSGTVFPLNHAPSYSTKDQLPFPLSTATNFCQYYLYCPSKHHHLKLIIHYFILLMQIPSHSYNFKIYSFKCQNTIKI